MERCFNTEGPCFADEHYMVDIRDRLETITRDYVAKGKYFVINKGRQYGKTTTLMALAQYLCGQGYIAVSMDFQNLVDADFADGKAFVQAFVDRFSTLYKRSCGPEAENLLAPLKAFAVDCRDDQVRWSKLFDYFSDLCGSSPKPVVLIIDEVDAAGNFDIFVDFLANLRYMYINRRLQPTFQSVILAGLHDIKHLKKKMRPESEHQLNSPWNIAANFGIELGFDTAQIAGMLTDYESDHHTGMDVASIAGEIYEYTSGYPVLVSYICKLIDEELDCTWNHSGIDRAVKIIIGRDLPLFDSMSKQLDNHQDLRDLIESIVYEGRQVPYGAKADVVNLGEMYCFLKNNNGKVAISNRVFEMVLLEKFITEETIVQESNAGMDRQSQFILPDGHLDMNRVMSKFAEYYADIAQKEDPDFLEKQGRKMFLIYLKPIINGDGNFYLESETMDGRHTDLIVDYAGEQFIVELKIWRGEAYNAHGEAQLLGYLNQYHLDTGYLLSFDFNQGKIPGMSKRVTDGKTIVETVV